MTKLQEFLEYQRKQCENERTKYKDSYRDYTSKAAEDKGQLEKGRK